MSWNGYKKSILPYFFSILFYGSILHAETSWLDRSHHIFLPSDLSSKLDEHLSFPIFWWNFLIIDPGEHGPSWEEAGRLCEALQKKPDKLIKTIICGSNLKQFQAILSDWAQDYPRRHPRPSSSVLHAHLEDALAKASLPGIDKTLLSILQVDPMRSYEEYLNLMQKNMHLRLRKERGYFFDPLSQRILIPIQFNFLPSESVYSTEFENQLNKVCGLPANCARITLLGPHAASIQNQEQVMADVSIVSKLGFLFLLLQIFTVLLLRRWRLLLLIPPVLISTFVSAAVTILIFGSIHGLTLSFGVGIIGLVLDFGLHSSLNMQFSGNWKANSFGLLTTVVGLLAMACSRIPLLCQLMTFSFFGLVSGFLFYYFLHRRFPDVFRVRPFPINPKPTPIKTTLILLIMVAFPVAFFVVKPNLAMNQFNYQSPRVEQLSSWLSKNMDMTNSFLHIESTGTISPAIIAAQQAEWAHTENVAFENISRFFPTPIVQKDNLKGWRDAGCDQFAKLLPPTEQIFFIPFWKSIECSQLIPNELLNSSGSTVPTYIRDFSIQALGQNKWLSIWFADSPLEVDKIKSHFPNALSLSEIVSNFPQTLARELTWMIPSALLSALVLLFFYYQNLAFTLLSLIPFFSGLGLFALAVMIFHLPLSFISVIALVMIFGLSFDYGIFATNLFVGMPGQSVEGVWTSLILSALVSLGGFAPMIFCKHPVLIHLGQALVLGTIGTLLGALWGIPGIYNLWQHFKKGEVND